MPTCLRVLAVIACLLAAGCHLQQAIRGDTTASPVEDLSFFDGIVTFDAVFSDPKQRALYAMHAPVSLSDGGRWYGFELEQLRSDADFPCYHSMVWVVWAPAGTLDPSDEIVEGGGRDGGFVEFVARTPDGTYDVQVVENLRPNTVPAFDVREVAAELVRRYTQVLRKSPKEKPITPQVGTSAPSDDVSATPSVEDSSFFDRIVTFDAVLSDPKIRSLYRMYAPTMEGGQRGYAFALSPQPGMKIPRHYDVITVVWAPAETSDPSDRILGGGGPGGGFIEFTARTHDGVYDVRVTEGMLLPNTVSYLPTLDVEMLAKRMVQRYSQEVRGK